MLLCWGFSDQFQKLIATCISIVSYSISLNGSVERCVFPKRGLRQGDPMSPYLLCAGENVMENCMELK